MKKYIPDILEFGFVITVLVILANMVMPFVSFNHMATGISYNDIFGTGGVQLNENNSSTLPQGPGYGYYGPGDIYTPPSTGGSGSTSPSVPAPTAPSTPAPSGPSQEQIMAEIDAAYNPSMDYLNQVENQLRNDLPNVLRSAQEQYNTAYGTLSTNRNQNLRQNQEYGVQAGQKKEDAMAAARRLYNELRTGYNQRFGGASSAGQAAYELSGVEQQRQLGLTGRSYADTVRALNEQKTKIDEGFQNQSAELERQKNEAITKANADFQAKLLQISQSRAQLASEKANMRLQALQALRNQIMAIQQQNLQFQQTLALQQQNSTAALNQYAQQLTQAQSGAQNAMGSQYANMNPNSQFTMTGGQQPTTQGYSQVGQIYNAPVNEKDWWTNPGLSFQR